MIRGHNEGQDIVFTVDKRYLPDSEHGAEGVEGGGRGWGGGEESHPNLDHSSYTNHGVAGSRT